MSKELVWLEKSGDRIQVPADAVDAHRKQGWWVCQPEKTADVAEGEPSAAAGLEFDMAKANVGDVLKAIEDGEVSAEDALEYEIAHKGRSSLISKLEKLTEVEE